PSGINYEEIYVPQRMEKFRHTIKKLLNVHPTGRRLLDIGAATGEFAKTAHEYGLEAYGVEFSEYAVSRARELYSLQLWRGTLSDVPPEERFDFIHLNHVFEHLVDPSSELLEIKKRLQPNGWLYIEVPFQFHPIERLKYFMTSRSSGPFSFYSLHHPYFYTPATLQRILYRYGFKVMAISCFDWYRYSGVSFPSQFKRLAWFYSNLLFGFGNWIEVFAKVELQQVRR
ncbi:MAG: methyltransferase domain-containing protein, partial [Thermodesulfobacteriota bacterium]